MFVSIGIHRFEDERLNRTPKRVSALTADPVAREAVSLALSTDIRDKAEAMRIYAR